MEIKQSDFVTSAVVPAQYPKEGLPEVAFVGKSNVGKSSLINSLTNRRKLAKVSGTPGKTRLINFFLINNLLLFVDLPGYGYAKVSKTEKQSWGKMVEAYFDKRSQLKKVVLLVDSRHNPTEDDVLMYNWIKYFGFESIVVSTKIDKLSKNEISKSDKIIRDTLELPRDYNIVHYSSLKKIGKEELLDAIFSGIIEAEE